MTEPVAREPLKWEDGTPVMCGVCEAWPAIGFLVHVGCPYCGGGDCGDTGGPSFYCKECATFFHISLDELRTDLENAHL
jgi:hypothetical protein